MLFNSLCGQMSKSRGNVVDPMAAMKQFGTDQIRYFLLREGRLHLDGGVLHAKYQFHSHHCIRLQQRATGGPGKRAGQCDRSVVWTCLMISA